MYKIINGGFYFLLIVYYMYIYVYLGELIGYKLYIFMERVIDLNIRYLGS